MFIPGRVGELHLAGEEGIIGEIHPAILNEFGLEHPVVVMELSLENLENVRTGSQ